MDAKITKQRLSNLLSYDWLKILVSIAAAVTALVLFFTMVGTRPTAAQTFTVYSHANLAKGADFSTLGSSLQNKNVFSYDILEVEAESFYGNTYGEQAYTARRAAGMGTVYLMPDTPEYTEEGTLVKSSTALLTVSGGLANKGETTGSFGCYDTVYFLEDCKNYLEGFYHGACEVDMEAVRACFLARNGNDKRFRSAEKTEEGVLLECARIEKLESDYRFVVNAFEEGKLSHIAYEIDGVTSNFGISLGKLKSIGNLVCYSDGDSVSTAQVSLMILYNGSGMNDLRFETVSFLKYLVENYA